MAKKKFYAVAVGRRPGVYKTWEECEKQVKGFRGARFKGFATTEEAQIFVYNADASAGEPPNDRSRSQTANKKFYAVAVGKKRGVYKTWADCEKQIKGFRDARYKGFPTIEEAHAFLNSVADGGVTPRNDHSLAETATDKFDPEERPAKRPRVTFEAADITIGVHFDGGSRGNPGLAGAGANVEMTTNGLGGPSRKRTFKVRKYLGSRATNNVAEYQGLICGLREARNAITNEVGGDCSVTTVRLAVYGDSHLVIQQMKGSYQCKSKNLVALYQEAQSLVAEMKRLAVVTEVSFDHVYRKDNSIADALANEAMDARKSWTTTDDQSDSVAESVTEQSSPGPNDGLEKTAEKRWLDV